MSLSLFVYVQASVSGQATLSVPVSVQASDPLSDPVSVQESVFLSVPVSVQAIKPLCHRVLRLWILLRYILTQFVIIFKYIYVHGLNIMVRTCEILLVVLQFIII